MTRITILAAAAALTAGPALAETHVMSMDGVILADQIQDGRVYALGDAYDEGIWDAGDPYTLDSNYQDVGEIEDVVLNADGQMIGITAEVGGFLGIGDNEVMLPLGDVRLVPSEDGEYNYVTRLTEDQLEELPTIDDDLLD